MLPPGTPIWLIFIYIGVFIFLRLHESAEIITTTPLPTTTSYDPDATTTRTKMPTTTEPTTTTTTTTQDMWSAMWRLITEQPPGPNKNPNCTGNIALDELEWNCTYPPKPTREGMLWHFLDPENWIPDMPKKDIVLYAFAIGGPVTLIWIATTLMYFVNVSMDRHPFRRYRRKGKKRQIVQRIQLQSAKGLEGVVPIKTILTDPMYLFCGFIFQQCRQADTYHALGIHNYFHYYIIVHVTYMVAAFLGPLKFGAPFLIIYIFAKSRAEMRAKLGLDPDCHCSDCCLWMFCAPCAATQEAMIGDMATNTRVGFEDLCCALMTQSGGLVGSPRTVTNIGSLGSPRTATNIGSERVNIGPVRALT